MLWPGRDCQIVRYLWDQGDRGGAMGEPGREGRTLMPGELAKLKADLGVG